MYFEKLSEKIQKALNYRELAKNINSYRTTCEKLLIHTAPLNLFMKGKQKFFEAVPEINVAFIDILWHMSICAFTYMLSFTPNSRIGFNHLKDSYQ